MEGVTWWDRLASGDRLMLGGAPCEVVKRYDWGIVFRWDQPVRLDKSGIQTKEHLIDWTRLRAMERG